MPEAIRRLEAIRHDEPFPELKDFSEVLSSWLPVAHRDAAPAKPGTIENGIREIFNAKKKAHAAKANRGSEGSEPKRASGRQKPL
jgi:hypothetical protein